MPRRRAVSVALAAILLLSGTAMPLVRAHRVTFAQEQDLASASAPQLIAAAVEAGPLDYGTSPVYHAYAVLCDNRLPSSFVGCGAFEDTSLFAEIRLNWDRLSPATRGQLTPFIVRPTNARSIFAAASAAGAPGATSAAGSDSPAVAADGCDNGWTTAN